MAKTKIRKLLPKRIAGVKLPKRFRKSANRTLANPLAREIVSGAMVALGSALAAHEGLAAREAPTHPASSLRSVGRTVGQAGATAASTPDEVASLAADTTADAAAEVARPAKRGGKAQGDDGRVN